MFPQITEKQISRQLEILICATTNNNKKNGSHKTFTSNVRDCPFQKVRSPSQELLKMHIDLLRPQLNSQPLFRRSAEKLKSRKTSLHP